VSVVGGNGDYDPDWDGFSNVSGDLHGWMDPVDGSSRGAKYKIIDGLAHMFCESGAYGASWADIASHLPANPKPGRTVLRVNTDESNAERLYVYNGETTSWKYFDTLGGGVTDHPSLTDKNTEADIQHLTAAQVGALHEIYVHPTSDINHLTDSEYGDLHSIYVHPTSNVNHLTDIEYGDLHEKWTTGNTETVITAELANDQSIDNAIDGLITTHKNISTAHHTKYTDNEAKAAIRAAKLEEVEGRFPSVQVGNGASIQGYNSLSVIRMPNNDADCYFRFNQRIPRHFDDGNITIKFLYRLSSANLYNVKWNIDSVDRIIGEQLSTTLKNILNVSTAYDFPAATANTWRIHTMNLTDADLHAGDLLGIQCLSDASNTATLDIFEIWLE
jgi:hypothetical protein